MLMVGRAGRKTRGVEGATATLRKERNARTRLNRNTAF